MEQVLSNPNCYSRFQAKIEKSVFLKKHAKAIEDNVWRGGR